ncbi:MAG: RnfABCDGE type electron transport complex subunit D [Desulfobacterales bacterium]
MLETRKLIVSHAPFWHSGNRVAARHLEIIAATLPALLYGFFLFGMPALGVVALSVSTAIGWEYIYNRIAKEESTVADYHAALTGLIFGMLLPAVTPWWIVILGTFIAIIIGKQIFGGIGASPFNPAVLSLTILSISWAYYLDFNVALADYNFGFDAVFPLTTAKMISSGAVVDPEALAAFNSGQLFVGQQVGGIGSVFGLGLVLGGIYLIARGIVRWEIPVSFLAGAVITALLFHQADPGRYAGPMFHLATGYTLIGAFFLASDDASSPANPIPMLIYGFMGGFMTVLIRNIGHWVDGVLFAILVINLIHPLVDKIRPKAIGKVA